MIHQGATYQAIDYSCCAVARAQRSKGQNHRFAQQPPRGWLRAAKGAIFGAQHFLPLAWRVFVARHFLAGAGKINEEPFL